MEKADNDCLVEQCFKSKSGESIFQCGSEDQAGIREHEIWITRREPWH